MVVGIVPCGRSINSPVEKKTSSVYVPAAVLAGKDARRIDDVAIFPVLKRIFVVVAL